MPTVPTPECAIQFQSEVNGLGNTDIVHFVGPSGQLVSWIDFDGIGQGGLTVSPASSILFANVIGNINVSTQMNSGLNANPSTFFRGDGTWQQVNFSNITGIAAPNQIPNISGGIIQSGLVATQFGGTGQNLSTSGSATGFLAQNASHIISTRSIAATDIPVLPASIITSGQLALAQGGTGVDLSASGGANLVLAQDGSHVISARTLTASDVPNLPASKITSGQVALAEGGTGVDLSSSGAAHNFLAINASHVISAAQPAFSDISGTATSGQYVAMVGDSGSGGTQGAVPAPPAGSAAAGKFLKADGTFAVPASSGLTLETNATLNGSQTLLNLHGGANVTLTDNGSGQITINSSSTGGTIALDTNNSANSSQSVLSLNNGTGIVTANPTSGNVTFTLQPAQASTIGGVQSLAAVTSNWIDSISTLGVPHASQPAFTDISGTASTGQIPNLAASKITSGQLALAQGGTGVDLSASGSSTAFLAQNASQVISARSIAASDVPSLDASKITTGQIGLAQGGTGVDLSAAGGTSNFLAINASHVISAAQPTLSDIFGTGNLLPNVAGQPNIGSISLPFGQIFANQFVVPSGNSAILIGTESSPAPNVQAGNDILYLGDSVSHTAQLSNNGNSFQSIATWDTTTPTSHGVVIAGNFPAVHTTGPGTAGQVLVSNGPNGDPTFQSANASLPIISSTTKSQYLTNNGTSPVWDSAWISVVVYGADPTGATDSSAAINAAIDACPTNGGVVFFPPGTYLFSSQITLDQSCTLMGWNRESTLKKGFSGIGILNTASNTGIIGLSINGNKASFTGDCIDNGQGAITINTIRIQNNYIYGCAGQSINFHNTSGTISDVWIDHNYIVAAGQDGIYGQGGLAHFIVSDNFIDASAITTNNKGITFHSQIAGIGIDSINIHDNDILGTQNSTGMCAEVGALGGNVATNIKFHHNNCYVTAATNECFSIVNTFGAIVDANACYGNGFAVGIGLEIAQDSYPVVTNNYFALDSTGTGNAITVNSTNYGTFSGNTINGWPETANSAAIKVTSTGNQVALTSVSESGNTASFVASASLPNWIFPGNTIYITGVNVSGYNTWCTVLNSGWSQSGKTFQCLNATTSLGAGTGGNANNSTSFNNFVGNTFTFSQQGTNTLAAIYFNINNTGAVGYNNAVRSNVFNGAPGTTTQIGVDFEGSSSSLNNTVVQSNTFNNLTVGVRRNSSPVNSSLIDNSFTAVTTPYGGSSAGTGEYIRLFSNAAPTITSHFNTSGDSISSNNGTDSFSIHVGTGAGTSTGTLGLPTARTGWFCYATNENRAAVIQMTSSTTTSATLTNFGTSFSATNWTNSDFIQASCFPY